MRSLAFLTLMMLAAASGFTRYSDSTSMHVAENTSDCHVNFLPSTHGKDRSFITIDSSQPMIMTDPNSLYGYQYYDTTALVGGGSPADRGIIFGDWSSLVVGYWTGVDILANPYESTAYSKGNVQVRAMLTADVALRHEESFAYAADMATN